MSLRIKKMLYILITIMVLLILAVLALLVWQIRQNLAARGFVRQSAAVGLLQQQLEAIRESQSNTPPPSNKTQDQPAGPLPTLAQPRGQ